LGCHFAEKVRLGVDIVVNKKSFVSVIVPVYNGGKFLQKCLDALFTSDYPAFEVVVVDDGSTDDSAEISREKGATVISTPRPQSGPAAARNLAAEKVRGEILLFVDADVVVKPDTIAKVAARFENQPEISALFGSYDDEPGEKNFLSQYRNLLHHFVHQNSNPEASTFWAGLGAIRREAFAAVSGFDCERFAVPSIEDIELGARLRAAGHRILLAKEVQAKHLKKWGAISILRTDIFCRALPWSKLIMTSQGLINDMNLKTADRLSAVFVALTVAIFPFIFWKPVLILVMVFFLLTILFLNLKIFRFFSKKKGRLFALASYPWQFLYFFYSGATFVLCWFWFALPRALNIRKGEEFSGTGFVI
jgi:glycosyltransferase involved in cell wall biosynthesis